MKGGEGQPIENRLERNNQKSGSTIFYLTLTHVQQGTKRKSTFGLVKKVMFNKSKNVINIFINNV